MSDYKDYTVEINGIEHTFSMTEAQVKERYPNAVEAKQASASNKARTTENKSGGR